MAFSVAVDYMKGKLILPTSEAKRQDSAFKMLSDIALLSPRCVRLPASGGYWLMLQFINRAHMLLSSNTLVNLEIYQNQTDGGMYGSLLWLLDQ